MLSLQMDDTRDIFFEWFILTGTLILSVQAHRNNILLKYGYNKKSNNFEIYFYKHK